jgi:hypothetical protein
MPRKCFLKTCNSSTCGGKDVTIKSGCMTATAISPECKSCPDWNGWE